MIKTNRQNGITLIALIITIIVLLILAGVTLSMIMGDSGLFGKAKKAKEQTEITSEKEEIALAVTSSKITDTGVSNVKKESLQKALDAQFGENKTLVEDNEDGSYTIKMNNSGKREYTLDDDGTLIEGAYSKWDGTTSTEPTNKTSNEIHIYTVAELKWIADKVNNDGNTFEGYTIYLENNLDFGARETSGTWENTENEALKWTAIGKQKDIPLKATFEGNNHIIKGVYINDETKFNGIFGNSSSILNLTVKNSYIKGKNCSGTIVGAVRSGTIENCHNINSTVELYDESSNVGGVAGQVKGVIKNCTNIGGRVVGKKAANGSAQAGGVVGTLIIGGSQAINCYNTGNVTGEGNYVGGVVGVADTSSTIQNCYNTGNVTGEGNYVGGVVGIAANIVTKCYNTGTIVSKGTEGTGGIIGDCVTKKSQDISLCYNSGTVQAPENAGGISGYLGAQGYNGKETKCYNKGKIICTENNNARGEIVGSMANDANVTNCFYFTSDETRYGVGKINDGGDIEAQRAETHQTNIDLKSYNDFIEWIKQK